MSNHNPERQPIGDPGRPTLRGIIKKERNSGYNKYTLFSDIIDESMLNCMKNRDGRLLIEFRPSIADNKQLDTISVIDNIENGFEGLDIDGERNPLNFIHHGGERHDSDEEWSEFGAGLTAASQCCSRNWELITRYKTCTGDFKFVRLTYDWEKMMRSDSNSKLSSFSPSSENISEEEYNSIHPFQKGSILKYSGVFPKIFSGNFQVNVKQLVQMIATKYYSALVKARENGSYVQYRNFNSDNEKTNESLISHENPPTEQENHPHDTFEYKIEVRENDDNEQKIFYKQIKKGTFWFHEDEEPHKQPKFSHLTGKNYKLWSDKYPKIVDTISMKGTRTSGTPWSKGGRLLPKGSLVIERYNRIQTEDTRFGGSYIGFVDKSTNGENNYLYLHLKYRDKTIGKDNFGITYRKNISGNLAHDRNTTPLNRALKKVTVEIRKQVGSETKFKEKWEKEKGVKWNDTFTYEENVEASTKLNRDEKKDLHAPPSSPTPSLKKSWKLKHLQPHPTTTTQEELEIKTPPTLTSVPTTIPQEELEIKTPPFLTSVPTTIPQEELEIKTPPTLTLVPTITPQDLNSDREMLTQVKKLVSSLNFEMDEAEFLETKILILNVLSLVET